jgi:hypothetical protein
VTLQLKEHWHKQRATRSSHAINTVDSSSSSSSSNSEDLRYLCHRSLPYPLPVFIDPIGAAVCTGKSADVAVQITFLSSVSAAASSQAHLISNHSHPSPTLAALSLPVEAAGNEKLFCCSVAAAGTTVLSLMEVRCDASR